MPHIKVTEVIPAPAADVFRLVHDYTRRLEWDTLLKRAELVDGCTEACLGATTVCTGRTRTSGLAVQARYIAFRPPSLAAIKMINRPAFLQSLAATIRHRDRDASSSSIEYVLTFAARPKWLRFLLHPIMRAAFVRETKRRLRSLKHYLEPNRNDRESKPAVRCH
jgi:hypothetical protein